MTSLVLQVDRCGVCSPIPDPAPESLLTAAAAQEFLVDLAEVNLDAVSSDNTSTDSKVLIGAITIGTSALVVSIIALVHAVNEQTQQSKKAYAHLCG